MGRTERRIAEFIVETRLEDIPERAYRAARDSCLDGIGVMLAGAVQPHGRMITEFATREGHGDSTIVGTGRRTSMSMAALANGTLGHALDFDDMGGFGHPTAVLLPTLLASGEAVGISGRELLAAYVIGFEVGHHMAKGARYHQGERGFHSTSVFGTMAATAAAARVLGLSVEQTLMALGTAGSMPSGVVQNFGTYTKPLHAGLASRNGVMAAQLAQSGWLANENFVESRVHWAAAYFGSGNYNAEKMCENLGRTWTIQDTIVIKKYPCCGSIHSTLDSLLGLMQDHGIALEDVERVEVTGFPAISHVLLYPRPAYAFQGKFSVYYTAATALIDGRVNLASYTDEKLERSEYEEAARKIEIKVLSNWDPAYRAAPLENPVTVRLKDGRVFTRSTNRYHMHGSPSDPLTPEELHAKFRANARLSLAAEQVEEALQRWCHLDEIADIREALDAVSGSSVRS